MQICFAKLCRLMLATYCPLEATTPEKGWITEDTRCLIMQERGITQRSLGAAGGL